MTPDSDTSAVVVDGKTRMRCCGRWRAVVLSAVLFVSGALVGGGAAVHVLRHEVLRQIQHPDELVSLLGDHLVCKMSLSDEQGRDVRAILARHQAAFRRMRTEVQPRVETQLDALRADVAAALNEKQKAWWTRHFDHVRSTWIPPVPAERQTPERSGPQ